MNQNLVVTFLAFFAALAYPGEGAPVQELAKARDPLAWKAPAGRPPLPKPPAETQELTERFKVTIQRAEKEAAERASFPKTGSVFLSVTNDSQAYALGIAAGDVLLKIDDNVVEPGHSILKMRKPSPQKITVWRYGRGEKEYEIKPGPIGTGDYYPIDFSPPPAPVLPAGARWDGDLAQYRQLYNADPELAEIALLRALDKGLVRTDAVDAALAELAMNQGQYQRALDFGWRLLNEKTDTRLANVLYQSALASAQTAGAFAVAGKVPAILKEPFEEGGETHDKALLRLAAELKLMSPAQRTVPHALAQAQTLYKDDVLLRAEPINEIGDVPPQLRIYHEVRGQGQGYVMADRPYFADLANKGEMSWTGEPSSVHTFWFKPAVLNALFTCTFKLGITKRGPEVFQHGCVFRLRRELPNNKHGEPVLTVWLSPPDIRINAYDYGLHLTVFRAPMIADENKEHQLQLCVCNNVAEVVVDGVSLFNSPIPALAGPTGFALENDGMKVSVKEAHAFELMDEKQYRAAVKDDANKTYRAGQTRLHRVAAANLVREVQALIDAGADVNLADQDGATPLHHAARHGSREAALLLLSKGAKPDAQDKKKATPAKLARENGFEELARILGNDQPVKPPKPPANEF